MATVTAIATAAAGLAATASVRRSVKQQIQRQQLQQQPLQRKQRDRRSRRTTCPVRHARPYKRQSVSSLSLILEITFVIPEHASLCLSRGATRQCPCAADQADTAQAARSPHTARSYKRHAENSSGASASTSIRSTLTLFWRMQHHVRQN